VPRMVALCVCPIGVCDCLAIAIVKWVILAVRGKNVLNIGLAPASSRGCSSV
jgi:hypothetical protein